MPVQGGAGGGGSGGDIRAGGAFYELVARDNVSPALKRIENELSAFKGKMKSIGGGAFFGGLLGGGFGGVGLATIGEDLGRALQQAAFGMDKLKSGMSDVERMAKAFSEWMDDASKSGAEWRGTMTNRPAKIDSIRKELAELGAGKMELYDLMAEYSAETMPSELEGLGMFFTRGLDDFWKERSAGLQKFVDEIGKIAEKEKKLDAELRKLQQPESDPSVMKEFNAELDKARESIFQISMTPIDKQIRNFEKMGISFDKLQELRTWLQTGEVAESWKQHQKAWEGRNSDTPWLNTALSAIPVVMEATKKLSDAFETTRGGLGASSAQQRFGYGDMVIKQTEILKTIAENTDPWKLTGAFMDGMGMK